jgi:hypothetical protein
MKKKINKNKTIPNVQEIEKKIILCSHVGLSFVLIFIILLFFSSGLFRYTFPSSYGFICLFTVPFYYLFIHLFIY